MTRSLALRYALAPVCVALAVLLHLSPAGTFLHPTGLFLLGIVAAGWFGGAGPGFLAAVLATFALPQLIAMSYPLVGGFFDLPRFVTFGITGLAVGWGATRRRRAEAALRESEKKLEHKVAERTAALRDSEERYALAMQAAEDAHWDWNIATDEYFATAEKFPMYGFAPDFKFANREDFLARAPFHPEDRRKWNEAVKAHLAGTGDRLSMDLRLLMNGETRWVHISGLCVRDTSGAPVRWIGTTRDVTDRKRMELAQRASDERYARAMEASNDGLWEWNPATDEIFVTARARELWAIPEGVPIRTRADLYVHGAFHAEDRPRIEQTIQAYLAGRTSGFDIEYRVIARTGEVRWIRSRAKAFPGAEGRPALVTGSLTDVTERKRAEEALRESEQRYERAMLASNAGLWEWDARKDEYYMSPRHLELLGFAPGTTFSGREDFLRRVPFHPEDLERWRQAQKQLFVSGDSYLVMDLRVIGKGEMRWVRVNALCFRDAAGTALRWTGSVTDVTEAKRAEEALRRSEERYSLAMEASEEGHFDVNLDTDEHFTSERLNEIHGFRPGMRTAKRSEFIKHVPFYGDDAEKYHAAIAAAEAKDGPERYECEFRIVRPSGEVRWLSTRGKVTRDAEGRAVRRTGVVTDITERKLAADVLRESEARFRTLTELSSDWYWEQDEKLRFTYLSSQAKALTGYSGESSLGKTRWEIENMEPLSCSWAEHQAVLAARQPFRDLECRRIGPDGTVRYLSMSGAPVFDESGRFKGYQGIGRNITERKRIEEELRARQEMLDLAQESARAVAFEWRLTVDGPERSRWSAGLAAMHGVTPESYDGSLKQYKKLIHPEDWPRVKEAIQHAQRTGDVAAEYRVLYPDGSVHWLQAKGRMFFDAEGNPVRMVGFMEDVTQRRHADEELRSRQEMLELAQKVARAVAFEWRAEREERWPPELEAMYGLPPGSFPGSFRPFGLERQEWKKLVHPDDWAGMNAAIQHAYNTGDVAAEYRVIHADGSVHWLQSKGRMFFDAEKNPVRMIGLIQDVTALRHAEEELKALERKLRQAQRLEAMGTLAGGIAHDFNNILGAILGYGEMAMRDAAKGTRMRRDLESIMTAGERGRALIDRVLAFSRSSVGERVAVHVEKVVREALDLISAKLPPNVTLHAKLHAGSAAMLGDATQVHQVLMNLATNAIQAMPAGGRLGVSLKAARSEAARAPTIGMIGTGEYIVLEVADTGCGIAPEILDRIFDPFFTTKDVGTGTGLGLSLVHGIVTELGGAIDVASTPGAGSTFTVYLPRAGDAADLKESQEPEMPRGDGQRVLVVDDEEPLVRLATRTLEDLGYVPTGFTSSAAALAAFRADPQRFDALLTDERMPGMSGSALIREIRGIRDRIPIVLMSGYVGGKVASGAREAGAEEVLKKPLSARDLAGSLARVLRPT